MSVRTDLGLHLILAEGKMVMGKRVVVWRCRDCDRWFQAKPGTVFPDWTRERCRPNKLPKGFGD